MTISELNIQQEVHLMAKYNKEELRAIFHRSKTRKAFVEAVARKGVGEGYGGTLWQTFRSEGKHTTKPMVKSKSFPKNMKPATLNRRAPAIEEIPEEPVPEQLPIQEVGTENVTQKQSEVLEENTELKKSWGKALDDMEPDTSVLTPEGEEPEKEDEDNEETRAIHKIPNQQSSGQSGLSLDIGRVLALAIKNLNNGVLWTERPLIPDETEAIDMIGSDMQRIRFEQFEEEHENADIWMMLLAGGILPAIGRVDLIPSKVKAVVEWWKDVWDIHDTNKPVNNKPAPNTSPPNTPPPNTPNTSGQVDLSNYTPNVQAWMQSILDTGGKVSPRYISGSPVDYDALKIRNILRNLGDDFTG